MDIYEKRPDWVEKRTVVKENSLDLKNKNKTNKQNKKTMNTVRHVFSHIIIIHLIFIKL